MDEIIGSSGTQVQIQQQQQSQSKKKSKNKKKSSKSESNIVTKSVEQQQLQQPEGAVMEENMLADQLKQQLHIGDNKKPNLSHHNSSSCSKSNSKVNGLLTEDLKKSNACPSNSGNSCSNKLTIGEHKQPALNGHHMGIEHTSVLNGETSPQKQTVTKKSKRKSNKNNTTTLDGNKILLDNVHCPELVTRNGFRLQEEEQIVSNETKLTTAITTNNTCSTASNNANNKSACPQQQAEEQSAQEESENLCKTPAASTELDLSNVHIEYKEYESELQMHDIMRLIQAELSEPYSIYTYRYFIYNWPKLCFLAAHDNEYVGAIVCKLDMHMNVRRGYIAMLAVRKEYRKLKIGTTLVQKAIEAMLADKADEVVLETEMSNLPALRLYENLGFVRDKRLFRYYLNGVDALRLKLWFR